ncbi:hypothetical protein ASPZODRAFT_57863 [Penicilliopsis zonata CBS 506.65]|uniref:Uncharacterized protein n=1 Tax=Penicilliopsis zonata CBS 506.65 TaxID=1073090 RepID=A0A1L9SSW8_9EURO|nr:hypothetical protein ASPZODRAFT_57863 [Penicilliopsis zonata CBS 506.65]OJJ50213.1 hypothetical protein ASPZODRAFT_57863 [Penicilliopsis zonata CBS 506.65]
MAASNQTVGSAIVINQCFSPVYLWSVDALVSPQQTLFPGDNYTETFRRDQKTGGVAIKITTVPDGLYESAPQTVFAYNLVDSCVWYDLSDVFGDPFSGEVVEILPANPAIYWGNGVPPAGSQVRTRPAEEDIILFLC